MSLVDYASLFQRQSGPDPTLPPGDSSSTAFALLDNPILNSLNTAHSSLALVNGRARSFPPEIGPLSGVPDQSSQSYDDLRGLSDKKSGDRRTPMALFFDEPPSPPPGWTLVRGGLLDQMLCPLPPDNRFDLSLGAHEVVRSLTPEDAPAMVELARLTEPGPFELRTIDLGAFFGIFHGSALVAMAGQRLSLPGFVEVSAVCTHPIARGRGYAPGLMSMVITHIFGQGKIPFLHSFSSNAAAIAVYHRLGFTFRRNFHLAVLQVNGETGR